MRTIFSEVVLIDRTRALALGVAGSAALALCLLALVVVQPAEAAFPGKNGKIAFVSNRDAGGGEIYTIGPNGGAATRITFPTGGSANPAYSPDGTKIAFTKGYQIFVMGANGMNPDGTGATQITSTATAKYEPAWSPDGTKIAYVANSFDVDEQMDLEIWVINADGTGTPEQLTNNTFPDTQPAWSPFGNEIAFVSARTGDSNRNIYVMDADPDTAEAAVSITPNTSTPVYQGHDEDPSWSPDGTEIVYSNGNSDVDVWKIKPDGTGKKKLAGDPSREKTDPAWSPDGTKMAFVASTSGTDREIWTMDADGTNQQRIHTHVAHDINPDWQQDSIPPNTTVISGPPNFTSSTSAGFSFVSSETGSSFRCSLDGAAFTACVSPNGYSGLANGSHTFQVQATDVAGNVDLTPAAHTWTVDTQRPSGRVVINGGRASTTRRTVTLKLSASDPAPASGVSHMRFKNNGSATWSGWYPYTTSKSWALSAGAGKKTVYAQYKDRAGNVSAVAWDSITYRP